MTLLDDARIALAYARAFALSSCMLESDLSLTAEIKLYYDVYVPENLNGPAPLLIAVHGYGAHKRYMMREARAVAPENFVIASVQGPHQHYRPTADGFRIGFGWLSEHKPEEYIALHHNFLLRVIDKLADENLIEHSKIFLYGFSQACALNFKFAFTHPEILAGIVGVCGGIPGDLETNEKYKPFDANTFYLYGDDDEFYTQEQFAGFDAKLQKTLPNFASKHYNAKHEITEEMRVDIKQFLS
ncbi:MAG: alpha/beta hydrolase [Pyrinomonadaceae bacterium]